MKTNPAEEPHNSSKTQPPGLVGPRLYQLKPICSGLITTDWINLRRWQRMKYHARWITDFILEAHERTFFVTVTFFRFVSDRQAKEAGRRFFQKRLAPFIEGYVRVIERQRNGRPHVHWIFRLIASACTDDWKIIKLAIQRYGRMFGFGRFDCDPVEHPKKLAWYLVKSFKEGALRASGKVVTYSNNIRRVKYATGKVCDGFSPVGARCASLCRKARMRNQRRVDEEAWCRVAISVSASDLCDWRAAKMNGRKETVESNDIERRCVSDIRPAPENDQVYRPIELEDPEILALAQSIRKNGLIEPIVISEDGYIISGHRRWNACLLLSFTGEQLNEFGQNIPVRVQCGVKRGDPEFLRLLREANGNG